MPNTTRKQWREWFGDPKALALDVVGPLTTIVEQREAGSLMAEKTIAAAKLALKFARNTAVQISRKRQKRAIHDRNPKLSDLAEKESIYEDAAPELFGDKFVKEAKEREEQLCCLNRASGKRGRGQHHHHLTRAALWPEGRQPNLLLQRSPHAQGKGEVPAIPEVKKPRSRKKKTFSRRGTECPSKTTNASREC